MGRWARENPEKAFTKDKKEPEIPSSTVSEINDAGGTLNKKDNDKFVARGFRPNSEITDPNTKKPKEPTEPSEFPVR